MRSRIFSAGEAVVPGSTHDRFWPITSLAAVIHRGGHLGLSGCASGAIRSAPIFRSRNALATSLRVRWVRRAVAFDRLDV